MLLPLQTLDPKIPRWDKSSLIHRDCPSTNCGQHNNASFMRPDGLSVSLCRKCGIAYLPEIPNDEQLEKFYQSYWSEHKYKSFTAGHAGKIVTDVERLPWEYGLIKKEIQSLLPRRDSLRIIEIGFGDGHFLKRMEREGAEVLGLELSRDAVEFARTRLQLDVELADFLDFRTGDWDVIVMKDLIEHVPQPSAFFAHASSLLKAGGLLVIWTPHCGRNIGEIQEDDAVVLRKDLEHLQYYNAKAVAYEARLHDFVVEHIETLGRPHYNWAKAKTPVAKEWIRRLPYYTSLNRLRRLVMRSEMTPDVREGRYNLFCILRKERTDLEERGVSV